MTTPRIGDTVHYTDGDTLECHLAVISRPVENGTTGLTVFGPTKITVPEGVPRQDFATFNNTGQYTPGTWHHIH